MLRINRMFTVLVLSALLLSACQPVMPTATTARPHTPRQDAPPYGVRGPYAVGVHDFVIDGKAGERSIPVSVWYPALNPEGRPEIVIYALDFPTNEFPNFTTAGRALREADPDMSGGPYPLLLYIHAAWSFRQEAAYLVEHLASHGFVVIAPALEDNWGMLGASIYSADISRPRDASRTLDLAEELTASDGALAGLIDMEHVAASGWSWGGQIALELGGARLNLNDWQASFCKDFPEDGDCVGYQGHFEEMAALAGLQTVPEALWPDWRDPRVDVIAPLAPGVSMFGGGGLDNVQLPVLFVEGSADGSVGPALAYRRTFETLPSQAKTRVTFEGASHLLYMNSCTAQPEMAEGGFAFICQDSVWDMTRAHDLVNHFVTAFLLAELKGDADAAAALAPANVAFPGIQYETTAFGAQ